MRGAYSELNFYKVVDMSLDMSGWLIPNNTVFSLYPYVDRWAAHDETYRWETTIMGCQTLNYHELMKRCREKVCKIHGPKHLLECRRLSNRFFFPADT